MAAMSIVFYVSWDCVKTKNTLLVTSEVTEEQLLRQKIE